jgi:hypothetical protein
MNKWAGSARRSDRTREGAPAIDAPPSGLDPGRAETEAAPSTPALAVLAEEESQVELEANSTLARNRRVFMGARENSPDRGRPTESALIVSNGHAADSPTA